MANYQFLLNFQEVNPPKEWQDIEILATFNNNIQPNINIDSFTFVGAAKKMIDIWIEKNTIFEGLPFTIIYNDKGNNVSYDGFIDFVEGFEVLNPMEVRCKIKQFKGLNILDERLRAISYGYLAEIGQISKNDYITIPVVVKKKFDAVETIMVSLSIYIITKELIEANSKTAEITTFSIKVLLSQPLSKPAEIYAFIKLLLLNIAYYAAMLIALFQLLKIIRQNLVPRLTKYKGITLKKALEIACNHMDLTLDCDIELIDKVAYLPSKFDEKIRINRKDEGIPNISDYGYNVGEMFDLVFRLTNSMPYVDNNTLVIRNEGSDYWQSKSDYILPDVLTENYEYNLTDCAFTRLIKFEFDSTDEYTMPLKYNGHSYDNSTVFQVITYFKGDNQQGKLLKGLDEISIPLAMAERRDKLSPLELLLQGMYNVFDTVVSLFGGSKLPNEISNLRGSVLISQNFFNVAKLVYLENGTIPSNYKDKLSAEAIYNQFYEVKSFVSNPEFTQRILRKNIRIPFKFSDYVKLAKNSYFTTIDGKTGKFTKLHWSLNGDYANCDYWIAQQYVNLEGSNLLTETKIKG